MTSGDKFSGAGDGNEPRQSSFNWGLTPSDPETPPAVTPPTPDEPAAAEEVTAAETPAPPIVPGASALEVPLPPLTPAPSSPPSAPVSPAVEGLLKLPPLEPPATEAMDITDLPTGMMDVADLPTGAMDVADLPTGAMDISDLPTGMMDVADLPTAAMQAPPQHPSHLPPALDPALEGATEVLGAQSLAGISAESESVEHDAVGDLFGEDKFVEYEDQLLTPQVSTVVVRQRVPPPPRPPIPRGQVIALAVGGGLVAALALVALFLLGTRIGENSAPVAAASASATPTADPTEAVPVVGPVSPGEYQWDELAGGECIEPFASAWEQEYTVVDCDQSHAAQLLTVGEFEDATSDPYPDAEELAARTSRACSTDAVIDFAAAKSFADLEIIASFPATIDDWDAGNREYYCFATRAGDDALTASVAQPQTPEN